jgi:tetratricopeptide (TPR) repeat protein
MNWLKWLFVGRHGRSSLPPVTRPAREAKRPAATADHGVVVDDENRSVRVFVSSTFIDMRVERDKLVTETFPALRARYRERGVELFEVDLRWGITEEQQQRGETLPTLLAEIDRCRPYFIGMLGDRYGWVPPPQALTDTLKADYPAIAEAQGASVTAMEIMHGVLSRAETASHALFFERDPSWDWRAKLSEAERSAIKPETAAEQRKLEELKRELRRKVKIAAYKSPEEIGDKVSNALDALLEARFPDAALDAYEQTARLHRAYSRERRRLHVGAESYLTRLDHWMETANAAPVLITGASGCGKSTLIANWLYAWRAAHPESAAYVFEHYLGASPDSADPMLILRRLWEHANRATGETIDPPAEDASLSDVSTALTRRLAQMRLSAERNGARILVALDGLDKLGSDQDLHWLPSVPGVHFLTSSVDGEAKSAALARGFSPLDVKPLNEQERRAFISGTLGRWRRALEQRHITRILAPAMAELAGSPLYLKTVLDELRISADHARLLERLENYRVARGIPDLFDRVLQRLEDDCEPGLVAKTLPLIWASRAGLEEAEITAISNATPLAWATVRNGLDDGFRDQRGRLAFAHDYLAQAVAARYLKTDDVKRAAHLTIADRFEKRSPDGRCAEELPFQLRAGEAWARLAACLTNGDMFDILILDNLRWELVRYWTVLSDHADPAEAYARAMTDWERERGVGPDLARRANGAGILLSMLAKYAAAVELGKRAVEISAACWGADHDTTLAAMSNLAGSAQKAGDHATAEALLRRVLAIREHVLGADHPRTLNTKNSLGTLLRERLGENWRATALASLIENVASPSSELAAKLRDGASDLSKDSAANPLAKSLIDPTRILSDALADAERKVGKDHPMTLTLVNNLGLSLKSNREYREAEAMYRRALAGRERILGPNHPDTLVTVYNLGALHFAKADYDLAKPLLLRALRGLESTFGTDHPSTIQCRELLAEIAPDT